ncbi:hypothetical protein EKO27_g8681 [Xylaria grammica]|uniref:Uncharacterized protein n=1 Tax=Xylaria grammica TaxID=363999 RepID=A0A439CW44_9PEZI|nr:hypothetical protein F5X98DRAFT_35407 [Xylaria grammica]RWA06423.1 hypothetical protein EKO27_g8681 [Xylaria grammica]
MATFLEDPRLRQRWNQISQTTEAVTENAAAGIWSFGHTYVTPCLGSVASTFDSCTALCLGDREERARRARERQRARGAAEFSFDFYDDWDEEFGEQNGGILGGWRAEDWDRLVAGSGKRKGQAGEIQEQPRTRARGMSYGTRGNRRRASGHEDPTIIPSTAPLGFLGRLPFKIGGTLRYKPSAANLQEHPGSMKQAGEGEREPLLGGDNHDDIHPNDLPTQTRKRSGTAGSGDTSDSFRSRGDLFPSDEEGEEDAVPLDDEFTIALDHADDRSSSRTKSSKGKRIASYKISRSESRTTIDSTRPSLRQGRHSTSGPPSPVLLPAPSLEDLQREELRLELEEDEAIEKKRQAAANLALHRGLSRENLQIESVTEVKSEIVQVNHVPIPDSAILDDVSNDDRAETEGRLTPREHHSPVTSTSQDSQDGFIPARLPHFR